MQQHYDKQQQTVHLWLRKICLHSQSHQKVFVGLEGKTKEGSKEEQEAQVDVSISKDRHKPPTRAGAITFKM